MEDRFRAVKGRDDPQQEGSGIEKTAAPAEWVPPSHGGSPKPKALAMPI